jgi:hypothetical protein
MAAKQKYLDLVKVGMGPIPAVYATNTVQRLVGFHVVWHLFGGRIPLINAGWNDRSVTRNRTQFRKVFGVDVTEAFPDIAAVAANLRG